MSKGVQYMIQATVYYAGMNLCIKYLNHIPAHQIIFIRSVVTFCITFYLIKKQNLNLWGNNKGWLVLRGVAGFAGLFCYVITVQHMPLASAVTIQYLSPVFTLIIAHFMLDDELKLRNWIFTLVSLSGVFLVKGFDERISQVMLGLGVFSALMSGFAYSCIRKVNQSDHALVIVFYFPLVTLPFVTPYSLTHWTAPNITDWLLLIATGIFTQFGQYFMTKAYQLERVANVSILTYLGTLYALAIGYLLFDEKFSTMSLLGMTLIIGGVVLNLLLSEYKKKNAYSSAEK
ncbi:MAG: DMT family transporter [Bacteroidia bacterium]|nr:DMT family transporter [Bacteroidia bacterium]